MSQIKFRAETDLAAPLLTHRLPQKPAQKAVAQTQCAKLPLAHSLCPGQYKPRGGVSSAVSRDISSNGNQTC